MVVLFDVWARLTGAALAVRRVAASPLGATVAVRCVAANLRQESFNVFEQTLRTHLVERHLQRNEVAAYLDFCEFIPEFLAHRFASVAACFRSISIRVL